MPRKKKNIIIIYDTNKPDFLHQNFFTLLDSEPQNIYILINMYNQLNMVIYIYIKKKKCKILFQFVKKNKNNKKKKTIRMRFIHGNMYVRLSVKFEK